MKIPWWIKATYCEYFDGIRYTGFHIEDNIVVLHTVENGRDKTVDLDSDDPITEYLVIDK